MTGVPHDILGVLRAIGRFVLGGLALIGRIVLFAGRAIARAATPPYYPARLAEQLVVIG